MNAVKTRWGHLRDYFMKKHREYKATKSGQAAERRKKWHLYEIMSFLAPLLEPRETFSNMVNIEIDSTQGSPQVLSPGSPGLAPLQTPSPSHTPPPVQTPLTPTPPPSQNSMPPPQRRSAKRKSATSDVDSEIIQALKHDNDDDDMWARSLVPSMKKLDHLDKMEFRVEVQASLLRFLRRKEDARSHNVNIQATEGAMNYTTENYYQWC